MKVSWHVHLNNVMNQKEAEEKAGFSSRTWRKILLSRTFNRPLVKLLHQSANRDTTLLNDVSS